MPRSPDADPTALWFAHHLRRAERLPPEHRRDIARRLHAGENLLTVAAEFHTSPAVALFLHSIFSGHLNPIRREVEMLRAFICTQPVHNLPVIHIL